MCPTHCLHLLHNVGFDTSEGLISLKPDELLEESTNLKKKKKKGYFGIQNSPEDNHY